MKLCEYKDFVIERFKLGSYTKREFIFLYLKNDCIMPSYVKFLTNKGNLKPSVIWTIPSPAIFHSLEDAEEALSKYYDTVRTNINIDIPRTAKEVL